MTSPPAAVSYGTVTYRRFTVAADGTDTDALPDQVGRNGRVVLTPNVNPPRVQVGTGASMLVLDLLPVVLRLVDGVLVDGNDRPAPQIVVPSPETNPSGWNWGAEFFLDGSPAYAQEPFSFDIAPGETVNLAAATPVAANAGVSITRGEKGDQGDQGVPGVIWRGAWSSSTAYAVRDAVSYNGSSWYATAGSTNVTPAAGQSWSLLAAAATTTLTDNAVTTPKIADGAVTSAKIADGTIVAVDLADGAVTSAKILDGTVAITDLDFDPATQAELDTAIAGRVATSTRGAANGVATLGPDGKLTPAQAPAGGAVTYAVKTTTTTVAPGTAMTAEPQLSLSLPLGRLLIEAFLVGSAQAEGWQVDFQATTAVFSGLFARLDTDSAFGPASIVATTGANNGGSPPTYGKAVRVRAVVNVTTAGTFGVRFAPAPNLFGPARLDANSYLSYTKIL